ncbi:hypothetical protein [Ochrobactrum sp. Marseille-Q0166]|uniref:hypothetical protein n=1 Tax=Ochrobactrum sp. Marseille-Q0166 TaxID=2761105 RepID=UPI00165624FC|nr:hypothetical protein [Ochrobactrum sp. Marseille-Q0166]MBC8718206.1 hypothetical protein [Ochrobactrum sp. Marseille-Q0166]
MEISNIKLPVRLNSKAYASLTAMAERKGYKPSAFAQMLFDAAFAARVGQERGTPISDRELDLHVRFATAISDGIGPETLERAVLLLESNRAKAATSARKSRKSEVRT